MNQVNEAKSLAGAESESPRPAQVSSMNLTREHVEILRHTRDRAAGGYYCGDSPAMQELVANGLMIYAGRKSFVPDSYFQLTSKGRATITSAEGVSANEK
jgi:hypothetical protein